MKLSKMIISLLVFKRCPSLRATLLLSGAAMRLLIHSPCTDILAGWETSGFIGSSRKRMLKKNTILEKPALLPILRDRYPRWAGRDRTHMCQPTGHTPYFNQCARRHIHAHHWVLCLKFGWRVNESNISTLDCSPLYTWYTTAQKNQLQRRK